jgi:hypothetical protein
MAYWVKIDSGEVLRYSAIRAAHPDVSFPRTAPANLSHLGYLPLDAVDPPLAPTPQDEVIEGQPEEYTPGRMRQTWIIQPRPAPDAATIDRALRSAVLGVTLSWSS